MHAKFWFIGLVFGIAHAGYVSAAGVTTHGLDDSGHTAHESHTHVASGDALTLSGDSSTHTSSDSSDSSGNAGSGGDHSGDVLPGQAPAATNRPAHLGWQSLLPGSIQ